MCLLEEAGNMQHKEKEDKHLYTGAHVSCVDENLQQL